MPDALVVLTVAGAMVASGLFVGALCAA